MTQRQAHVQKLETMMAEYRVTKSSNRKNDLRKGIKRLQKELKTYDFYTNRDGWIRQGLITIAKGKYQEWLEPDGLILLQGWARNGLSEEKIAHNIGITRETLRVWKKKYSGISAALKKGREVVDLAVENALLKKALSGDVGAICFWLKNRKADVWRDRHENAIDLMAGNMGDFEIEVGAPDEQAED